MPEKLLLDEKVYINIAKALKDNNAFVKQLKNNREDFYGQILILRSHLLDYFVRFFSSSYGLDNCFFAMYDSSDPEWKKIFSKLNLDAYDFFPFKTRSEILWFQQPDLKAKTLTIKMSFSFSFPGEMHQCLIALHEISVDSVTDIEEKSDGTLIDVAREPANKGLSLFCTVKHYREAAQKPTMCEEDEDNMRYMS